MKFGSFYVFLLSLLFLCGCGHSVLIDREINGVAVYIPIGDGSLGVTIGCTKTTTATLRGGASVESTTTSSGGIFSGAGGVSKITNFKTNSQLNEGNIVKIMVSPEVPDEAKIALATNLAAAVKAPKFMPSVMQTEASTIYLGSEAVTSNNIYQIERRSTGLDRIVDTVPQVTTPIAEATRDTITGVSEDVSDIVGDATEKVLDTTVKIVEQPGKIMSKINWRIVLGIIAMILLYLLFKTKKSDRDLNTDPVLEETDPDKVTDIPTGFHDSSEKPEKKAKGFWGKLIGVLVTIVGVIKNIPPEIRKKIADTTVKWFKKRKLSKTKKK